MMLFPYKDKKNKDTIDLDVIEKFKELRNEFNSIYCDLQKDKIAQLNLEKVFDFFNAFSTKIMKEEPIEYDNLKGLISTKINDEEINSSINSPINSPINFNKFILNKSQNDLSINFNKFILKNGKKVILSKKDFSNLNNFNNSELIEILRLLDILIIDRSYDDLRSAILDKINSISMIRFVK